MSKKYTLEDFKKIVNNLVGNEYSVLSKEYINNKTKVEIIHNSCGNKYFVTPNKFILGRRCPKCSHPSFLKTQKEYEDEVKNLVGNEYTILSEYKGTQQPIIIRHNICGHEYKTPAISILRGRRCPKCSHPSRLKEQDTLFKEIKNTDSNYTLISKYVGRKVKITLRHELCGNEFQTYSWNFLKGGVRCPECKNFSSSKFEKEVQSFIKSTYNGKVKNNVRIGNGHGKEIDIYIPEKQIGIECDGLYWHSVQKNKSKFNLLEKTKFFNDLGIRIVHIFEDEWQEKQEIVKDKLKSILNLDKNKIYARKCVPVILESSEANLFLNKFHIQGCGSSTYKVGLKYNEKLVAVMTFIKSRKGITSHKEESIELFRFATDGHVVGGFSKLLKFAINTFKFSSIITFADIRWSSLEDNVYIKNGFKLNHLSEPGYWYFKTNKRVHRSAFMKYKLKEKFPELYNENLTEKQIMEKAGYKYIYDCGNMVFTFTGNN